MTQPVRYGLLTVKLSNPPEDEKEAFEAIKNALGLKTPQIDEMFGIIEQVEGHMLNKMLGADEKAYVVGIELNTLIKLQDSGHPNVVGWMHAMAYNENGRPDHLKRKSVPPVKKDKGPRP